MSDTATMTTTTTTTTTTATSATPANMAQTKATIHLDNGGASSVSDINQLPAVEALRLLSATLEWLVKVTGDVPPTPPPQTPTDPKMSELQAEKDIIARVTGGGSPIATPRPTSLPTPSSSFISKSSSRPASPSASAREEQDKESGRDQAADAPATGAPAATATSSSANRLQAYRAAMAAQLRTAQQQAIDGVNLKREVPTSCEASTDDSATPPAIIVVGAGQQPTNSQHGAITRKFYSKLEPPITITQYLTRLHQFCPMSTAVYLATSLYIHRLAVEQRAIPVTRRNVHRLVLAGLRVASKALEDLAYPHAKVARVGGVSESELARLEISFCFLADFELVIGREGLTRHWEGMRDGKWRQQGSGDKVLELRLKRPTKSVLTPE